MGGLSKALRRMLPAGHDVLGVGGMALIVAGVDMVYRPAAFMVAGAFMLALAIKLVRR